MISNEQKFFIIVLRDFVNNQSSTPPASASGFKWDTVLSFSSKHQVTGILYHQCKKFLNDQKISSKLLSQYSSALYNSTNIRNNYKKIAEELKSRNIPFVSVKGLQIANLYPVPELRTMGDIDPLIHKSDFPSVTDLFFSLGFHYGKETEHEITFKKNLYYYYEIHEFMINKPEGEDEIQKAFYNNYWNHLLSDGKSGEQKLDWSFHFMFLLQHMRQHILWEGIGFRQFMDLAVVICNVPDLDWDYIVESAKKIELYGFLNNVLALIDRWFDVKAPIEIVQVTDDFYEYVTNKVFDDGVFGFSNDDNKTNVFEKEYRESKKSLSVVKLQKILNILFPSYKSLYKAPQYTFIDGRPYLLPIAWVYRIFDALKHKKFSQVNQMKRIVAVDEKQLDKRRSDIEIWGL